MALPMTADTDDRRTCATCTNSQTHGPCSAARAGQIAASRQYEPNRETLRRCEGYKPDRTDQDQRNGMQRWPGLKNINIKGRNQ